MSEDSIEKKVEKLEIGYINLVEVVSKLYNIMKICVEELKELRDLIDTDLKKEKTKPSYFT